MVANPDYNTLAYDWRPLGRQDNRFLIILVSSLVFALVIGFVLSSIEVPVEERQKQKAIPERIADFILEKEKEKPKVVPPPKPEPKPLPKPEPRVKKQQERKSDKPLTEEQKKAREKAQDTGLLALTSELADLIDTSEIDSMVATSVNKQSDPTKVAALDKSVLTSGVGKGSGGVNSDNYGDATIGSSSLSQKEILAVRQSLLASDKVQDVADSDDQSETSGSYRSEEEITLVFDQNKSKLYSIYNRERRKNPGLKGKVVIELTISPEGKVVDINIVSSELNNPRLERSLVARIKLFKFSADKSREITVTYPIEFLPS
ncbi:energy transducer TonB [Aliikangiella marina]|uniref:Energy transducer TonB n=1 Tax=Aliikangiella marina TaxID=1712262 RepID=A0A545TGV6_9GAMM|nr:AgmX/PglI C-terminal domain-containing protein [Aliikangiella marina]TQV76426.1 energy transducer TonB [Aliikangiella marina]